ncbi:MAG: hypothetical protein F2563_05120 [Actinobacteria bacterium]|uniref:Unannotated protein n=1 Tax=freshwater metagenome TaxID=449393 RepID=A0A6J6F094_9ZZZZ|nr:hypothetical protein [Actinomycetota bacterium]
MKYYMLESYKNIPQYAEVEMIGHCFDSGYSCYEVKYNGVTYKPFERDVISAEALLSKYKVFYEEWNKWRGIYDKTVLLSKNS